MADDFSVVNVPDENRYEIREGDAVAGFSEYRMMGPRIVFTHTVIDPEYGGQGLGSRLVRGALDDVRAEGKYRVVPRCPFTAAWLHKHHDFDDLVDWPPQ